MRQAAGGHGADYGGQGRIISDFLATRQIGDDPGPRGQHRGGGRHPSWLPHGRAGRRKNGAGQQASATVARACFPEPGEGESSGRMEGIELAHPGPVKPSPPTSSPGSTTGGPSSPARPSSRGSSTAAPPARTGRRPPSSRGMTSRPSSTSSPETLLFARKGYSGIAPKKWDSSLSCATRNLKAVTEF